MGSPRRRRGQQLDRLHGRRREEVRRDGRARAAARLRLGLPRGIQLLVRWHHEWWDGSGYPDGLEGEQIPLAARVLRIADTYASITGARPFRNSVPADEARKFLTDWAGIEFDPKVVKGLLSLDLSELNNAFSLKIE